MTARTAASSSWPDPEFDPERPPLQAALARATHATAANVPVLAMLVAQWPARSYHGRRDETTEIARRDIAPSSVGMQQWAVLARLGYPKWRC